MNCNRRRLHLRLVFLATSCLLLFSSGTLAVGSPFAKQVGRIGREFKLQVGKQVTVKGSKLKIKFVGVDNDSRCPSDVTCVWGGNAAVRFQLSTGSRSKTVTLNTSKASSFISEVTFQGYRVQLTELSPYPRSDRKIEKRDYVTTLLVSKE